MVVPMPSRELVLSHERLFEFERADDDVQNAILFDCPPESPPTQLPSWPLKHPFWSWMPFENVDVAVVDVTDMVFADRPPWYVEVEFVPVTLRKPESDEVPVDVTMMS